MNSIPKPDPGMLVETYRSYAHAIAAEVLRKLPPQLEKGDIEGAAELGLVEAAGSFDPSRGVLFKTFAYYRIRGAIYDGLRKMGWFPKAQYQQFRFEMAANEYLKDYTASAPTEGTPEEEYQEIKNIAGSVLSCYLLSLDEMTEEIAASDHSPEVLLQQSEERERVHQILSQLPEKNRHVLELYYFQEMGLEEIGQKLGVSKSWASRIHSKSLELFRNGFQEKKEKPTGRQKQLSLNQADNQ